ncbi:hypothetical protein HAX54_045315 [Datura stramonium]|uniref:Uncharacterized protein n=1 Tax=Datura stramonium TaxID=4076 RepID=A0ABS8RPK4_DATST|nr:hypothetical protein [Datura stramonium]
MAFLSIPNIFCWAAPAVPSRCSTPSAYHFLQLSIRNQYSLQLKPSCRINLSTLCTSYEVGAGFLAEEFGAPNERLENHGPENGNLDSSQYEVLLKGGEQVTSVLEEMAKLLEDMNMDEASEEVAVQLAAQGVIGRRVDEMESGFLMALDYMIQTAEKDHDDKLSAIDGEA